MIRPIIDYTETGARIRARRSELKLSVSTAASAMCVCEMAWYKYEQGKSLPGNYEDLCFLASILKTEVDKLVVFRQMP